mgnify:CR=1 FL=1
MINVGIIGFGYWGPNIVRNIMSIENMKVLQIADVNNDRLKQANKLYPSVILTKDPKNIFENKKIDAVIIATPVSTHFELAYNSLCAGKHTLVEKPLASSSEECLKLIDIADKNKLVLQVDHTFPYTEAVKKIKFLLKSNSLGNLLYYDSVRINLGLFQNDINVIGDLAIHDLSILDFLMGKQPISIVANGMAHHSGQNENIAYVTLIYDDNFIANIHVNWLSPIKIRKILIGCDKKMIVYNDLEPAEKIKIYDKGILSQRDSKQTYQMRVGYRLGDVNSPHLENTEALYAVLDHFKNCISKQSIPITDGLSGLRVIKIIEAATYSMENSGIPVSIS